MTAAEAREETLGSHRSIPRMMLMSGALALAICVAFEAWRPAFFFTSDNVTQWMPAMVEIARNLQSGQPALVSETLFGGQYDWSTDATVFPLISPLLPLLSPLAQTSVYYLLVDAITAFEFVVIAASFAAAATWLRRRHHLPVSDGLIVGTSLSYAFAPMPLLFGTSWMGFINAQAAWPLVFIALQFRSARHAVPLIAGAFLFSVFGGNLHPFSFLVAGSLAWAVYFSWKLRTFRPLLFLMAGLSLVLVVVYLTLGAGLETIAMTGRIRHFTAEKSSQLNVAPLPLIESFFLGPFSAPIGGPWSTDNPKPSWIAAMAYSAVNLQLSVAMVRGGWRNPLSRSLLVALVITAVFIWRPAWLGDLVAAIPVLRSTRWPFREMDVLLFHIHLLFLFTYRPLARPWRQTIWVTALLPLLYLVTLGAPTLGLRDVSRRLILSGVADEYWKTLRPQLGAGKSLVSLEKGVVDVYPDVIPFPLLPSHNFPALFGVVSVSGYSTSSPLMLDRSRLLPVDVHGFYTAAQAKVYLEHFPDTRVTVVRQINPPVWSIFEGGTERRLTLDPDTLRIRELTSP